MPPGPVPPVAGTVGVDSAVTVNNYVANDSFNGGNLQIDGYGDVTESAPGQMNHYEIRVSQNQIDVYGTNAFSGPLNLAATPLVHIATIPNVNLGFTRGLVWLEDAHYNADKFNNQRLHSFTWDNVGFDGPVLPRDLGFDVPDNTDPNSNVDNIGLAGDEPQLDRPAQCVDEFDRTGRDRRPTSGRRRVRCSRSSSTRRTVLLPSRSTWPSTVTP